VNEIWLIWGVVGSSVLLAFAAAMVALWQIYLRRELQAACADCFASLMHLREQRNQLEKQVQELSSGVRAEKAHVAQLQRQLELLRVEL
jgi:DNA recombination protein RmuC